jgi:hypothetical protein
MNNDEMVEGLARRYVSALAAENLQDNSDNRRGWLWFTCPAAHREDVADAITRILGALPSEGD